MEAENVYRCTEPTEPVCCISERCGIFQAAVPVNADGEFRRTAAHYQRCLDHTSHQKPAPYIATKPWNKNARVQAQINWRNEVNLFKREESCSWIAEKQGQLNSIGGWKKEHASGST